MADQEQIIRIRTELLDGISKGFKAMKNAVDDFNAGREHGLDISKEESVANRRATQETKLLGTQVEILKNRQKELNLQIEKYSKAVNQAEAGSKEYAQANKILNDRHIELAKTTDRLNKAQKEHTLNLQKDASVFQRAGNSYRNTLSKLVVTNEEWNEVLNTSRKRNISLRRSINDTDSELEKFGRRIRRVGTDVQRMERRLALMGRAMIGLTIASVVIFMQSFLSVVTALGGQVVALAGSLTFAASALGGTFVAAIAQALPAVGLLAAAMQRISLINEAITAHDAIRKAGARERTQDAEQEASNNEAIADAKRGVVDAENELTEARKGAKDELRELMLAERAAELQFTDSQRALRDAVQEGAVGEIAGAQLDVDESRLSRNQARQATRQRRRGGSENVKAAIRGLADAHRNLDQAQRGAAQSAAELTAQEGNLDFALSQLSETEKRFMRHLLEFRQRAKKVFTPITDIIIESFDRGLSRVEDILFDDRIVRGARRLATSIGGAIDQFSKFLSSDRNIGFFADMMDEASRNMKPIEEIAENIFRIFRNIAEGAAPTFRALLQDIVNLTEDWARGTSDRNSVSEFFERGLDHLRAWGRLLGTVVGLWSDLMDASSDSAISTLDDFTSRLQDARDNLADNREGARDFFNETSQGFSYLIDIVVRIGQLFIDVFDAEKIKAFSEIIDNVFIPAFELATELIGNAVSLLSGFFNLLDGGVGKVVAISGGLALAWGQVGLLGGALKILLGPLKAVLQLLGVLILRLGTAGLASAVAGVSKIAAELRTAFGVSLATGLAAVGPAIKALITLFRELSLAMKLFTVGSAVGLVLTGIALITDAFGLFGDEQEVTAAKIDEVTAALERQQEAMRALRDQVLNEKDANLAARSARLAAADAQETYNKTVKKYGKNSEEAREARINWKQAEIAATKASRHANDVERDRNDVIREGIQANEEARAKTLSRIQGFGAEIDEANKEIQTQRSLLRIATEGTDDQREAQEALDEAIEKRNANQVSLNQALGHYEDQQRRANIISRKASELQDDQKDSTRSLGRALQRIAGNLFGTGKQSEELGKAIKGVTNNVLKAFGAKQLSFVIPGIKKVAGLANDAIGGFGSLLGFGQTGGFFGDPRQRGPDDRYVGVAGGEAILTGHHQKWANMGLAFGKAAGVVPFGSLGEMFARDRREHRTAGYDRGGMVPRGGFPDADGALPGLDALAWFLEKKFGLGLVDGRRAPGTLTTSGNISDHTWGGAIDMTNGITTPQMDAANAYLRKTIGGGGEFSTNYAGGMIKQMLYRTLVGGNHFNHIHIALLEQYARNAGAVIAGLGGKGLAGLAGGAAIDKLKVKGPNGPLKDMLQHQANQLRKAANEKINKETMTLGLGSLGQGPHVGLAKVPENGRGWEKINSGRLSFSQLVKLGQAVGFPDPTLMAHIAMAESSGVVDVINSIGATGLWQIYNHPDLVAKFGSMTNAWHNAQAAKVLFNQSGTQPWVSSQGAWGQYAQRGLLVPQFGDGGIVPGRRGERRAIIAHGGETILPTHKYQTGGVVKDIRASFRDIQEGRRTGKNTKIAKAIEAIEELLRDGGTFDDLVSALEELGTVLTRRMGEWVYKIRKGIVSQVRTNIQIANRNLNILEEQGKFLAKEIDEIDKLAKVTRRRLHRADDHDDKQKLRAALNNLETRANELGTALNDNLAARLDAQSAIFEAAMARFDQRLGIVDLRRQITEARNRLAGRPETTGVAALLEGRGNILENQQDRIRRELRQARRSGNDERVRELQQALLENKLALLNNTEELREVKGAINETFTFNTTAWRLWRVAILNGMGGVMPQFPIPNQSGISAMSGSQFSLGSDSTINSQNNSQTIVQITEPMEVADPIALSNQIAHKMANYKAVER